MGQGGDQGGEIVVGESVGLPLIFPRLWRTLRLHILSDATPPVV